jgi:hypothetical protein
MSTYHNQDNHNDGEWDDPGSLAWSELDWQQYLKRREEEVAKFLAVYDEAADDPLSRLDRSAEKMGWEPADWAASDGGDDWMDDDDAEESLIGDPYTLHRHPVFVVLSGLFAQIRHEWRRQLATGSHIGTGLRSWDFADSLAEAERHGLLALECMDMGDLLLAVVHAKRGLRGINLAQICLQALVAETVSQPLDACAARIHARLFDLREVLLRVMHDCRVTVQGESSED